MPTIIDELIVALGIDASKYKRGQKEVDQIDAQGQKKRDDANKKNDKEQRERERKAKQGELERKKLIDGTTGAIVNLGKSLAGAVLGFEGIAGGIKYLAELNTGQAALGRTATRLGMDPHAIAVWGKAVELSGGKAEDATQTFAALAQQFSTLKTVGGTPGPLLQLLTQRGVAFRDAKGELLDVSTIFKSLSKSMAGMSAQDRSATLARAGVSEGLINLFNETLEKQKQELAAAEKVTYETEKSTKAAEKLKSQFDATRQSVDKLGNELLTKVTPAAEHALSAVQKAASGDASGAAKAAGTAALDAGDLYAEYTKWFYGGIWRGIKGADVAVGDAVGGALFDLFHSAPSSRAARNNNPGNIKAMPGQAADAQGFRIFTTLAEGVEAMQGNITRKFQKGDDTISKLIAHYEGTDTQKDPKATAAYIARVAKTTGIDANSTITADQLPAIMAAMVRQESGLRDSGGTPRAPTPNATGSTTTTNNATAGNTTTVTAPITINPPAGADPAAIGAATASALNRKITVAQANAGQS